MYRILVVDDELPIREELQLFAFERLRCVVCGQAENGRKALEFLQSNHVDIVITDIRMPVMDGLQLIEKAKKSFPGLQFILLSCLNDFEPIQHALKMGVVDYILKGTYTDDELAVATLKAVARIEESEKNRADRSREDYRASLRLLTGLVHRDEPRSQAAADRLRALGTIDGYPLSTAWIDFRVDPADAGPLIDELQAEYLASPEFTHRTKLYFMAPGGCLVFQNPRPRAGVEASFSIDDWKALSESLYHRTRFGSGGHKLCGNDYIPRPLESDKDLYGFLGGIEDFKEWRFYLDPGAVCAEPMACQPLAAIDPDRLRLELDSVQLESFAAFIQGGFRDFLLESRIRKTELFGFVSGLINGYLSRMLKNADTRKLTSDIEASKSLDDMIHGILAQFSRISVEKKYNKCIVHAIQFINRDLSKPLSLSIVAEKIGISASYLSSLFFRETGKQFNEYITGRRMEKAMELLRTTNCKVYEVSELVGIPSYRYFSRLFKDHVGVAPRDFK